MDFVREVAMATNAVLVAVEESDKESGNSFDPVETHKPFFSP